MRRRDALRAGAGFLGTIPFVGSGAAQTGTATGSAGYEPLGRLELEGTKEAVVGPDGDVAYLALTDGYGVVDLSDPADPTTLAERRDLRADTEGGPMRQIHDVKHSGDTLAVVGPANSVRDGSSGALLVDVSDPANPTERAFFPTDYPIHNCFLDGSTLYLTGNGVDGNPLVVVDAGGDDPTELARWSLTDHDPAWRDVSSNLRVLHDVWVRDGLATLAYWDAGTYLLDVSDPAAPSHVGTVPAGDPGELADPPARESLSPPGNHHYAATDPANDLLGVGKESWGANVDGRYEGGPSGIDLYDVSDPSAPEHLSAISPPPTPNPTFSGVWTTAHNFELRGGTLYSSWYQGGVKRHDVSDPSNPVEETWWVDPDATRFWAAPVARPGDLFVAPSMGTDDGAAGLWTFPDAAGTGGDPGALRDGETATGTDASTDTPTPPTSTPSPPATTGASSTAAASGFGAAVAFGGLGLAAWRAARRR